VRRLSQAALGKRQKGLCMPSGWQIAAAGGGKKEQAFKQMG